MEDPSGQQSGFEAGSVHDITRASNVGANVVKQSPKIALIIHVIEIIADCQSSSAGCGIGSTPTSTFHHYYADIGNRL